MNAAAETSVLISLLVRAMVKDRDAVHVTPVPVSAGTCFKIRVADAEVGKLIGRNGRIARLLRQFLWCIAQEHGTHYELVVNEPTAQQKSPSSGRALQQGNLVPSQVC
jgi:predicted RNA-binding protein YlqC (UPF0109 family)